MFRPTLASLAAVALVAACGERPEPVAPEVELYPVSVEGAGPGRVVVERRPERIAALAPGAAETVVALGARGRLVGAPAGVDPALDAIVRPSGLIDTAALAELRPDLILASPATDPDTLAVAVRRTAAAVYLAPDRSLRDTVRSILELGLVVGEPVRARRVARAVRAAVGRVEERVAARPRVRAFVDTGFLITVPDGSLLADLVRRAGGRAVGTPSAGVPLEPCRVARLRPAVLLRVVDRDAPTRSSAPRFAQCPHRSPRVVELDADLVGRAGPRVGEALEAVAAALHPDAVR